MERIRHGDPPPQEQIPCPGCSRNMRLVGQETSQHARGPMPAELLRADLHRHDETVTTKKPPPLGRSARPSIVVPRQTVGAINLPRSSVENP